MIYTVRGLVKLDIVDEAAITARYQIPGRAYADFATLRGDPSDGLPGVAGVGDKTAAALVRTFGSVDAICEAIDKGHGGFPAGARASWRRPATTWRSPRRSCASRRTRRCRR